MRRILLFGLKLSIQQWRIAAIVYFLQLCIALTLGMQVYEVMKASIGHSLEINKLLLQYDHTVITDFLNVHGASITPLIGQLRWLALAWLLFSVFINGGLLYCASSKSKVTGRDFWTGGGANFFPFLKIALVFISLALIWTALVLLPIAMFFEASIEYFPSEKYLVGLVLMLLAIWVFGLFGLFLWAILSRLNYLKTGGGLWSCIQAGAQAFKAHRLQNWMLFGIFAALNLGLISVYWTIDAFWGMTSPVLVLTLFVLQQACVFIRVQLRQLLFIWMNAQNGF